MHYLAFHLQLPIDAEQRGAEQFAALFFDQPGLDDDVGQAAFVFQRDEDDAGRGARTLAADDDTGGADQGAVAAGAQVRGRQEAALGEDEAVLKAHIATFRAEELEHRDIGLANEAEQAPAYRLLSAAIKAGNM